MDKQKEVKNSENRAVVGDHSICIAIDRSGSTAGDQFYWTMVQSIVESYANNPNVVFILWDSYAEVVSYDALKQVIVNRKGQNGTSPSAMIPYAVKCSHLILITDGQIGSSEVMRCEKNLTQEFDKVDVHFIGAEQHMNLSVAAPFTRGTVYTMQINGAEKSSGDTKSPIDLSKYYDDPDLFKTEFDALYQNIVVKNVGKVNKKLRHEILDLQKNLLLTLRNEKSQDESPLQMALQSGEYDKAVELAKTIQNNMSDDSKLIAGLIDQLVKACDLQNNYSFSLLTPNRIDRAQCVEVVPVESVVDVPYVGPFECPILCNEDIPCLLLKTGTPVLEEVPKKQLEVIMNCPLALLNSEEIVQRIRDRLDHVVGLKMAQGLFKEGNVRSPYSRDIVTAAFVFHDDLTCYEAVEYSMAQLFFGGKLVGNPILWTFVLYKAIKLTGHLKENESLLRALDEYMITRLEKYKTSMTLSGLPIAPNVTVPADVAVWYCLSSPLILGLNVQDERNRLRALTHVSTSLVEMVELLGYPYKKKEILELVSLYKALSWMMRSEIKRTSWREVLQSHYQGVITLESGEVIPVDGPSTMKLPLPKFEILPDQEPLTIEQLYYLSTLVDVSKTIGSIPIDVEKSRNTQLPPVRKNYGYADNYAFPSNVKLHPNTLRPLSVDLETKKFWRDVADERISPQLRISPFNRFAQYVKDNLRFPTKEEFILYLYQREKNALTPRDTLPKQIVCIIDNVYDLYYQVCGVKFENILPTEFINITQKSAPLANRFELDGSDISKMPKVNKSE